MFKTITIPRLSPNMDEAVLVSWQKRVGDVIEKGDVLYEVETDKVLSEVEAEQTGVLRGPLTEEGSRVRAGEVIGRLEIED